MGSKSKKSKKLSAQPSLRPEDVVFFIDRSLGGKLIKTALTSKGCVVERLEDHFKQRQQDEVWIEAVSEKKWIILSKDKFIENRLMVFEIIRRSKARMFVLTAGDMLGPEMVRLIESILPEMLQAISDTKAPFLIKITQKGNFHAVDIEAKLRKAGML
jgi:PIN domain-containing protein